VKLFCAGADSIHHQAKNKTNPKEKFSRKGKRSVAPLTTSHDRKSANVNFQVFMYSAIFGRIHLRQLPITHLGQPIFFFS
jgi:hypothetical protein